MGVTMPLCGALAKEHSFIVIAAEKSRVHVGCGLFDSIVIESNLSYFVNHMAVI